jgi:DNA-binding transcriptional regulator WhiA
MEKEERTAEFVGVMLGNGCIGIYDCKFNERRTKQYQLKVTLDSRNKQYTDYVYNLMKEVLEVKPVIYYKKRENTVDIRTFRKEKVLYALNEIGLKISPKWDRMEIPEKYTQGNFGILVVRGLFDTDGSVTIFNNNGTLYPRIEIRMSPSPAQQQIIELLNKLGFNYKIQKLERGKIKIRLSGKKELQKWFKIIGSSNCRYIHRAKPFL